MNRPEPIELENNLGPDSVTGEINRVPWMAYDVDEMDLYIAELKQKLEDVQASAYAEMVDAGMRERRLRRALYKACANWAACRACLLDYIGLTLHARKWERMYHRCRAKAEEYK